MYFPLSLLDISWWLAATALILLITSELLYSLPDFGARIAIEKKRLRMAALGSGIGFLVTVIIRVIQF
jgi:hypothetical protein